jgi:ectoine hydroxylase-related dioxygenase (phytanoyl-CoA dioxygenase family)
VLFRDRAKMQRAGDPYAQETARAPVWQIVNIWEVSPAFERLIHHPFIVKAISQLTGFGDLQVWHDQVQYKPANVGGATAWHQDAPLWPSIEPDTSVSAWLPFLDATEENGCMWMVPAKRISLGATIR